MLPKFVALFEAHSRFARSRGVTYAPKQLDEAQIGIARARLLAANLAGDREADEPAALLFALMLEAEALGGLRDGLPPFIARDAARARGLDLVLDLPDRIELRARVGAGATFDDVRAFVAARMRPLR